MSGDVNARELWEQSRAEFPDDETLAHRRYIALCVEAGLLAATLDELLSADQRAELDAGLARIAATRRRAEAESRGMVLP